MTTQEITEQIEAIIRIGVSHVENSDNKYKNHYQYVVDELNSEISMTRDIIADFTEQKLSVNRIEQEGYLRGLITMLNRFQDWIEPED